MIKTALSKWALPVHTSMALPSEAFLIPVEKNHNHLFTLGRLCFEEEASRPFCTMLGTAVLFTFVCSNWQQLLSTERSFPIPAAWDPSSYREGLNLEPQSWKSCYVPLRHSTSLEQHHGGGRGLTLSPLPLSWSKLCPPGAVWSAGGYKCSYFYIAGQIWSCCECDIDQENVTGQGKKINHTQMATALLYLAVVSGFFFFFKPGHPVS